MEAVDWKRGLTDPLYFADKALNVKLHPGQQQWLEQSIYSENALVTGNRWGKSFVCAVKVIHHALYRPRHLKYDGSGRYRIVTASITQDQANIVFDTVIRLMRQSRWLMAYVESLTRTPYPKIVFGNGTTVEARSTQNRGEYLLGNDYDLFIFDEIAFENDPEYVVEEVIQMRLADRAGKLDLVSTPNGRNWFYRRVQELHTGNRIGYVQTGDSRDNEHLSTEFLDERLKYFSDRRVQQNIMGQFVDSGGEVIPGEYIDAALKTIRLSEKELSNSAVKYISGWDLARKQTATVGVTIAVAGTDVQVVALERFRKFDWNVVIEKIKQRQLQYPGELVVDATGLGDVVAEQLSDYNPTCVIFTHARKAELLANVELFHARKRIAYDRFELPDGPGKVWSFEGELREARWDDNNRCDSLMALALALWPLRRRSEVAISPRLGKT